LEKSTGERRGLALEIHQPIHVRLQVWESLLTMLQVYAHAASLSGKEFVMTTASNRAWVKQGHCSLILCFRPETGASTWRVTQAEKETWGEFQIEKDGVLTFPEGEKPLDTAAIDWMEQLVQATKAWGIS
jgi:hypothetical protein